MTVDSHEPLFEYTAARWLWNEPDQLRRRYRKFDVAELLKVGVAAVGSASCVAIDKLPEGNFNKVLLLRMNDDREIVAKIPNPNAGRPYYTTESEVATMDFVRPIPAHLHDVNLLTWYRLGTFLAFLFQKC